MTLEFQGISCYLDFSHLIKNHKAAIGPGEGGQQAPHWHAVMLATRGCRLPVRVINLPSEAAAALRTGAVACGEESG